MTPNPQDSAVALEVEREAIDQQVRQIYVSQGPRGLMQLCIQLLAEKARASQSDGTAGWQPIASAPKDGVLSLFCNMKAEQLRETFFVDWMVKGEFCGDRRHRATHWMALPAAPNQGENHG